MKLITIHYNNFFDQIHHGLNGAIGWHPACQVRTRECGFNPDYRECFFLIYQSIHNNEVSVDSSRVYGIAIHKRHL